MFRRALIFRSCICALAAFPSSWTCALAQEAQPPQYKILDCRSACGKATEPVPIARPTEYPGREYQYNADARVEVRFTVTAEGKVIDPVIESQIGPDDFASNALSAVTSWRYKPATLNGVPVARPNYLTELDYKMYQDENGARTEVVGRYATALRLFKDNKFTESKYALLETLALPHFNFYERAMTSYLLALDEISLNNALAAVPYMNEALVGDGVYLDDSNRLPAMRVAVQLYAATGQLAEAFDEFDDLKKKVAIDSNDPSAQVIANIKTRLADKRPLVVPGMIYRVGGNSLWHHELLRKNFGFDQTSGKLSRFELRCDQQEIASAISENAEWHVPNDWTHCGLNVFGPEGATFRLLEATE